MAGEARVNELTREGQKQDCGCGCGGALCAGTTQEVIGVDSRKQAKAQEARSSQCDCCSGTGCACCG